MRKRSKDKVRARGSWQARYLMQDIAARKVPPHKLGVNMLDPGKGVVAFGVSCVDVFPWGKDKHGRVKGMGTKRGPEFRWRQRRNLVKHAQRLNKPSIEEDIAIARMSVILLSVATKNLPRKSNGLRTRALAASPTL
jgi:hypothetical protein